MPNLLVPIKQESIITCQKRGGSDFWQIVNTILNSGKSAIPPLFNSLEVSLHLIKEKCSLKTFLITCILMTQVSLTAFFSRTNLKVLKLPSLLKKS